MYNDQEADFSHIIRQAHCMPSEGYFPGTGYAPQPYPQQSVYYQEQPSRRSLSAIRSFSALIAGILLRVLLICLTIAAVIAIGWFLVTHPGFFLFILFIGVTAFGAIGGASGGSSTMDW